MSQNNNNDTGLSVDFGDELSKNLTIHKNVKQEIIITTEDKIKLVLISTKEILAAQRDWWTPCGLLISFVATLCTADFKNALGLTKDVWHAIFILLTIASAVWLLRALYKLYKNWELDNLDTIIEKIKLKNTSSNAEGTIVIESQKLLTTVPFTSAWQLNHWQSTCAKIVNDKMIFEGTTAPKGEDGSHINLDDVLEVGKTYEISCFVKSINNATGMFNLWCHDQTGSVPHKVHEETGFKIPPAQGEIVKLSFSARYNRNVRIHLQYKPGQGQIEVSDVKIHELKA